MSEFDDELTTTTIMDNLFVTLKQYSQTSKVTEEDLLRQRARQYAEVPPDKKQIHGDTLTVITFLLGKERYGIDVRYVRSVRPLTTITRVPNTPPFFSGVANVRGAVVTLLDLSEFFGLGRAESVGELIVIEARNLTLGLPVNRVSEVITIPKSGIMNLDDSHYAAGAYIHVNERIVILEADEIFGDERLRNEAHEL